MLTSALHSRAFASAYTLLVLAAVAFSTARAAPMDPYDPSLLSLTSSNFTSATSQGMWLVEFFSPYCKHCKQFAPTWKDLVAADSHLQDSSDFHFARVDCIAQGDLCAQHNINAYPSIELFRNATWIESYDFDRDFDSLDSYVQARALDNRKFISLAPAST